MEFKLCFFNHSELIADICFPRQHSLVVKCSLREFNSNRVRTWDPKTPDLDRIRLGGGPCSPSARVVGYVSSFKW